MLPKLKTRIQKHVKTAVIEALAILLIVVLAVLLAPLARPNRLQAQEGPPYRITNPSVLPPGLKRPTVTSPVGELLEPDILAVAGAIYFESNRDGNWNIYRMDTAGNNQIRLNSDSANDSVPRYSAAANKVAYGSKRSGNGDIYTINADGSGMTRLTSSGDEEFWPSWSPDGKQIAYTRTISGKWEVYLMNADGSNQRRLTYNNQYSAHPMWSKDGSKIVFMRNTVSTLLCDAGNWDIYVIGVSGSGQTKITTNTYGDMYPSWSHANDKITYTGCNSESSGWGTAIVPHIWTMTASGSSKVQITTQDDWASSWSTDGTKIVFATARDDNEEVYVMNSNGSSQTNLTRRSSSDESASSWGTMGPPPVAQFSGTPRYGVAPLAVQFTDQSTGGITSYYWNFGDGGSSTSRNPAHTYAQGGVYAVSLTVYGPSGDDVETKAGYINAAPPVPGLTYIGPIFDLHATHLIAGQQRDVLLAEADGRITVGDHAQVRLYFRNTGNTTLTNASVQVIGKAQAINSPAVWVQNPSGGSWGSQQTLVLSPSTLAPGAMGSGTVWIYVDNLDPSMRTSLNAESAFSLRTISGEWMIQMSHTPVQFAASAFQSLTTGSCLHNPQDFKIQSYAQYAVSKQAQPHTSSKDPDTQAQAIANLTKAVKGDYSYGNGPSTNRLPDVTLVETRGSTIGECRHYADLTVGLLRSLGIPSRYVTAMIGPSVLERDGHAWVEAYESGTGWTRVDTTWGQVGPIPATVRWAKADRFPLSSASSSTWDYYRCVAACYEVPIDCDTCIEDSNWCPFTSSGRCPSVVATYTGCVEDVTSNYNLTASRMSLSATAPLSISVDAPILVTQTVPFTMTTQVKNISAAALGTVTTTWSLKDYADEAVLLFSAVPAHQVLTGLESGETTVLTWTITPLVSGSGVPLLLEAEADSVIVTTGQNFVVKSPGMLPPLTADGLCGISATYPGQDIVLSMHVLDQVLKPVTGAGATVSATVRSTTTPGYSTQVELPYCVTCGRYESIVQLPADVPLGSYEIEYFAARPGHLPAQAISAFLVSPELITEWKLTYDSAFELASLTLNATVQERGAVVNKAGLYAVITTPDGAITVPLTWQGTEYATSFRPVDLLPNLGRAIEDEEWSLEIVADYYGSVAVDEATLDIIAVRRLSLPVVLRNR